VHRERCRASEGRGPVAAEQRRCAVAAWIPLPLCHDLFRSGRRFPSITVRGIIPQGQPDARGTRKIRSRPSGEHPGMREVGIIRSGAEGVCTTPAAGSLAAEVRPGRVGVPPARAPSQTDREHGGITWRPRRARLLLTYTRGAESAELQVYYGLGSCRSLPAGVWGVPSSPIYGWVCPLMNYSTEPRESWRCVLWFDRTSTLRAT